VQKTFRIADFVTPSANMKLRFVARDLINGSIVEAAVDDVQVLSYDCFVAADLNRDGKVDGADLGSTLSSWGTCPAPCAADLDGNGVVNGADLGIQLAGVFLDHAEQVCQLIWDAPRGVRDQVVVVDHAMRGFRDGRQGFQTKSQQAQ
jgi:hypothetical protein